MTKKEFITKVYLCYPKSKFMMRITLEFLKKEKPSFSALIALICFYEKITHGTPQRTSLEILSKHLGFKVSKKFLNSLSY